MICTMNSSSIYYCFNNIRRVHYYKPWHSLTKKTNFTYFPQSRQLHSEPTKTHDEARTLAAAKAFARAQAFAKADKSNQSPKRRSIFAEKASLYTAGLAIAMFAASFAAVPLYRIYCQVTGKGGQAVKVEENKVVTMKKDESRLVTVQFNSNTHSSMAWNFKPVQDKIKVHPGETALAFYRATNPLDELVIGVATYTVLPYEAAPYFNKIQCFCFEEQMLNPHEDVFMPVLFYIDPEFSKDPALASADEIVLSYTFFRSKDGEFPEDVEPIKLKKHN